MARTPFKLKSGNSAPFKQMGSFPMTRSQARTLSQKHMKDGAYTTMPGESRFQMQQRLRRAGTMGDTVVEGETVRGTETYLGKHLEAEKIQKTERKATGKIAREKFVKGAKEFVGGITDTLSGIGKKVKKSVTDKVDEKDQEIITEEKVESDDQTVKTYTSADSPPANLSSERKKYYDDLGWKYDETIEGYDKDGNKIE
jgi:hypothetical protein